MIAVEAIGQVGLARADEGVGDHLLKAVLRGIVIAAVDEVFGIERQMPYRR